MEHEAEPGGVLISYETYAHVKDEIDCEEVGQIQVKGIAYPVTTYSVLSSHSDLPEAERPVRAGTPHLNLEADPRRMTKRERAEASKVLKKLLKRLQG